MKKVVVLVAFALQIVFAQTTTVGLKDVYSSKFRFGNILNSQSVNNSSITSVILKEFNSITPENELKPDATIVANGSTDDDVKVQLNSGAKNILKFCQDNNIAVRGHTLVWHSQTPGWFFKTNFNDNGTVVSKAIMKRRMESYIKNMFALLKSSYPNLNLYAYDVVNEASSESGGPRQAGNGGNNSMWVQVYGDNSFIEEAFTFARKYAPATTKLFYNDYNEYIEAKRNYIANSIVKPLKEKGLIDGVGMQSHLDVKTGNDAYPSPTLYGQAITMYKNLGVEIHVSELDATIKDGNESYFTAQATYYKNIMNEILTKGGDAVKAVVIWGLRDNQSWRSSQKPLLFDGNGNKKAAYNELVKLIPESDWGKPATSSGSSSSATTTSSSSATPASPTCNDYQSSFCGGIAWADVLGGSDEMPTEGKCLYIGDFEKIQPNLNSTVAINGVENTCGDEWGEEEGKCPFNTKPTAKKDGGYYVYVKTGTINSYQNNGWQGIVAKPKPTCTNPPTTPIANPSQLVTSRSLTYYSLKGEPLGSAKPQKAGIYLVKEGYSVKKVVVK